MTFACLFYFIDKRLVKIIEKKNGKILSLVNSGEELGNEVRKGRVSEIQIVIIVVLKLKISLVDYV